ncbi:biotin--[acetyl-CoA-carboxylase] ligase [bacterium]|nr:biotin--[acetyl-CoA-carboxylase] ligase [bacterium]
MPEPLDSESVLAALNGCSLGKHLQIFPELDSTNDYLKYHKHADHDHGTLIVAEKQTRGRGGYGRFWDSPARLGLWFSMLFIPVSHSIDELQWRQLGPEACVKAVHEACNIVLFPKWPNDLCYENRKIGGVLTELNRNRNGIYRVIVGIGINVNQTENDFDTAITGKAASLKMIAGRDFDRQNILVHIVRDLEQVYLSFYQENGMG